MIKSIFAIGSGAVLGATLRWYLGKALNAYHPTMPLGTLVANLLGGYLVGVAIVILSNSSSLAPEWRLFIITGFLGALTTFSTFSAEVITLIQQQRLVWALGVIAAHVTGSLIMTSAGIASAYFFQK